MLFFILFLDTSKSKQVQPKLPAQSVLDKLSKLLQRYQHGLPLKHLDALYKVEYGRSLDYKSLHYKSLEELLKQCTSTVTLTVTEGYTSVSPKTITSGITTLHINKWDISR